MSIFTRMLAALLLATCSLAFGQDAPIASEPPDEPAAAPAKEPEAVRKIEIVELVAGVDVSRSEHQGLLARELARQAVLLSAREELGVATRDQALREGNEKDTRGKLVLGAQITFEKSGNVVLELQRIDGKKRQSLFKSEKEFPKRDTLDYVALSAWLTELSRGEIAATLRKAAAIPADEKIERPADSDETQKGELPKEIVEQLMRMTFASQFAAVRGLHELSRRTGDDGANGALVRGYANLAVLSELYWHPASTAFKARALLYAQRQLAIARTIGGTDASAIELAHHHCGYALALGGLHHAALGEFAAATKAVDTATPEWASVAANLCEFKHTALAEIPLASEQGELARVCMVLMAEHESLTPEDYDFEASSAGERRLVAAALELPHCWRVRSAAGRRFFDTTGRQTFDAAWYRDVAATPRLAPEIAKAIEPRIGSDADQNGELKDRAALVKALRTAAADDRYEPSLAVLMTLVEETTFVEAFEQAQMLAGRYERDEADTAVKDFKEQVLPIVDKHPLRPLLEEFVKQVTGVGVDYDVDRLLRPIEMSSATTALFELLDMGYRAPGEGAVGKLHKAIIAHADDTYRDLATLAYRYDMQEKEASVAKLYAVSEHAPQAIAGMIRFHWPKAQDKAAAWEGRYADDAGVIAMLASRYLAERKPVDARRCFEKYIKLSTTREWASLWAYRHLAETYKAEGNTKQWLQTLEDFLRQDGASEQRGSVQILIAQHYLVEGDFAQALQYAEAVDDYDDTDAQIVVAACREYQHRYLAAEQAFRAVAEDDPYRPQVFLWHRFCAQTGYGNLSTARNAVLSYAQSLDEEEDKELTEPEDLAGVGCFYLLENEPEAAVKWFTRAVEAGKTRHADGAADPLHAMYLAAAADRLGKQELRDQSLEHVAKLGEKFVFEGKARDELLKLAAMFQKSVAAKSGDAQQVAAMDVAQIEQLIDAADGETKAIAAYFAGVLLERTGREQESQAFLRRAVAVPVINASRSLAAVSLRRRGEEPNEIAITPVRRGTPGTGG